MHIKINLKSTSETNDQINLEFCMLSIFKILPLVQQVRGSIPGGVVNFHLKIFNLGSRRGGDVHMLIARLYITVLD